MMLHIKPKKGVKVRTPSGDHLKPQGEKVPRTSYWLRRIKCGDVVLVADTPTEKQGAKAK
ncbi:DUF2635 domain-containing protein [Sansalvadorimonas verongulae]|uniref:DUF2635 domain-containing protein n=1 Tax=Sansalvadorimonas verongulae TaxID=2172824 RepID=UPI0012BBC7CC|nr:DUF2635 domain-containing protein [Sansalvadorimonas verongulae]MTI13361.1 DUF2635 domain-containing protein [Sansalvadorimonas verongulae]